MTSAFLILGFGIFGALVMMFYEKFLYLNSDSSLEIPDYGPYEFKENQI